MSSAVITHVERPARQLSGSGSATAIVLMHSRAGSEHEALSLLADLDPDAEHLGLLPLGPLESPEGRHWYAIEREASPDPATFLSALDALAYWLDGTLARHGVELSRTLLGGFSQGAVMAYSVAFAQRRPRPAAVLAFSGYIPRVEGFDLDLGRSEGLPVAISHGSLDPNVNVDFGREARTRLANAGLAVTYREDPTGHDVTDAALAQARAVLADALA